MAGGSGAEQDRFGGWFGGNKADQVKDAAQQNLPRGLGAEQDRLGGWFGGDKADKVKDAAQKNLPTGSGAEQDRLGGWLGGNKGADVKDAVQEQMPKASGAEQDRFGGWFGGGQADQAKDAVQRRMPSTSGAEQDRYGGHFSGDQADKARDTVNRHLPRTSGAEQDRLGGWFGGDKLPSRAEVERNLPSGSGAEQDRYGGWFGGHKGPSAQDIRDKLPRASGAEQDRYGSHFNIGSERYIGTTTLGLLQHAVLPSFGLHAGLGAIAYGIGCYTDRAEAKDYLWPSGQVANAWWSAIGVPVVYGGLSVSAAWAALTYDQKLLLTGVTAWGARLFYHVASRGVRRGEDDPRYVTAKKQDPGFWNKAAFSMFLPEAVAQTLITLPFVLPFRAPVSSAVSSLSAGPSAISHSLAVFLFVAGFATEVLADYQLEAHTQESGNTSLNREGVWSIVRHPNYLGDALSHLSFSVLASSAGLLHPLAAIGPIVNYIFLRAVGGDKENEASQEARYAKENPPKYQQLQEYKRTKNSFWPSLNEVGNKWLWAIVAAGAGGVALEQSLVNFST
ncbi:Uu.00g006420.m01.CDS01 [Anthostomella pinea]|uniref:Uu.00g006420.m01.CDS01 n=1 Tax=Anthostomella pinea TaxID=933095 RepID=A0AAI8YJ08_9PEZI|nr:Uu.00g006420.m01.CDS01 [Anthostomella pinea]